MELADSDSSEDEATYTTTNVMLGYASKEPTSDNFSQLGGIPIWSDPQHPPSADMAMCKTCNSLMCLLLQLNGDLLDHFPDHERRLYVFACRNKACRRKPGAVRSLRGTKTHPSKSSSQAGKTNTLEGRPQDRPSSTAARLGDTIFARSTSSSSPQNPFSTHSSTNPFSAATTSSPAQSSLPQARNLTPSNQPQPKSFTELSDTFAEKVRLSPSTTPSKPQMPWPSKTAHPTPYPTYHLDAEIESLEPTEMASASFSPTKVDASGTSIASNGIQDDDDEAAAVSAFESTMDEAFQRFAARLAQNPDQVLRYEYSGLPLLYSSTDEVGKLLSLPSQVRPINSLTSQTSAGATKTAMTGSGLRIPTCSTCGGRRVFEMQLVPQAITELEAEEIGLDGMEWGTIIVGVCERDCMGQEVKEGDWWYGEEWVGVQWEESARPQRPS